MNFLYIVRLRQGGALPARFLGLHVGPFTEYADAQAWVDANAPESGASIVELAAP